MNKDSLSLFVLIVMANILSSQNQVEDITYNKAKLIHEKVITIDTHDDINIANFTKERNYTQNLSSQVNLPKMIKGGLDVAWFVVYTGQKSLDEQAYSKAYNNAIKSFNAIHRLTEEYAPSQIELALTSNDVIRINASGKKVAMIGVENAYPIGIDLKNIEKFYKLGARYISLSHQGHSQFSDSNTGEKENIWLYNNGLSDLGKQAVKEMNRVGVMIDVSHPSKGAFNEMIKLTKAPIIASHSSARALCDHSRNLDDEQLLMLKENGGVVQAVAFAGYLNIEKNAAYKKAQNEVLKKFALENNFKILPWKIRKTWTSETQNDYQIELNKLKHDVKPQLIKAKQKYSLVNVSDFVDHIDYMVKLIGIDHVGISSDFDGGGGIEGWNDASETFNVTLELVKRGYTEDSIAKLWGLNLLRVLDEVQRIAKVN